MQPAPIRRQRAVEVFRNAHGTLFDDEVTSAGGKPGRYLRWRWANPGVVVIPRWGDLVALVPSFRYSVADVSWELPRGGQEDGETVDAAAARELWEEAGLRASVVTEVGTLFADTGLIETPVHVVEAQVTGPHFEKQSPERMESLGAPAWFTPQKLLDATAQGKVRCGITIAATALAQAVQAELSRTAPPD
ncbi:NUDIX hydrolase [Kitasatospora sp. NPDC097643]|uniref:NUDIX hydrolase n=1 Tax=Kitasatospora sp. NPDC097643 TaxID=3157230 RepID=UPI00331B645A